MRDAAYASSLTRGLRLRPSIAMIADGWADDLRLSDIEPRFVCKVCGKHGPDVQPGFNWNETQEVSAYADQHKVSINCSGNALICAEFIVEAPRPDLTW